ncbi:MAG TPA: hypothetical protein VD995_03035 [Azospirillum sp.]|nr:hypothetical protein [Azospirillum sp.]
MPQIPSHPVHWDHKTILLALEATYGSDAGLTLDGATAIRLYDVTFTPMEVEEKELPYLKPYMGANSSIFVAKRNKLSGKLPLVGAGASGTPCWDTVMRICGTARTQVAKTASATIAAAAVKTSGDGAFTYTRTTACAGTLDRTATLTCTTGGGSGVAQFTVAAPGTEYLPAYNQTAVTMTTGSPFALPGGAVITIDAIGTPFTAGDVFTITLSAARSDYAPSSDRNNHKSGAIHFLMNDPGGQQQKFAMLGTRGAIKGMGEINGFPYLEVELTSLWTAPALAASVAPDFTVWPDPIEVSTTNTPIFRMHGNDLVVETFGWDAGNQVELVERVGRTAVRINDRKSTANIKFEYPSLGEWNIWATAEARTGGALLFQHGRNAGEVVRISAPAAQLKAPKLVESKKDTLVEVQAALLPVTGDDEWLISAR